MTDVQEMLNKKKELFIKFSLITIEVKHGLKKREWAERMSQIFESDLFPIIYLLDEMIEENSKIKDLTVEQFSQYLYLIEEKERIQLILQKADQPFRVLRIFFLFLHEGIRYQFSDEVQ